MNLPSGFTANSSQYRLYVSGDEIKAEKKGIGSWIRSHITNRAAYKLESIAGVLHNESTANPAKYDLNTLQAIQNNLQANIRKSKQITKQGDSSQMKTHNLALEFINKVVSKKTEEEKKITDHPSHIKSKEGFIGTADVGTKILMHKKSVTKESFKDLGKLDEKDDFSHLTQFCKDELKIDNPRFEKVEPGLTSGASGATVVLVKDNSTGELKSVLKFYLDEQAVLRDASTMKLMSQFDGEEYKFTQPMSVATYTSSGATMYCLAQTPAKGKPLDSLFENKQKTIQETKHKLEKAKENVQKAEEELKKAEEKVKSSGLTNDQTIEAGDEYIKCSEKLEKAQSEKEILEKQLAKLSSDPSTDLNKLEAALMKTAKNLGQLHAKTKNLSPDGKFDHAKEKKEYEGYKERFSSLYSVEGKDATIKFFEERLKDVNFSKSSSVILHGDFQPGNIFYDSKTQTFTWIDLDMCDGSIDAGKNKPIGLASYDVAYFSQWMVIRGLQSGISPEKVMEMRNKFEEEYIKSRQMSEPDLKQFEKELAFMKAMLPIKYLPDLVKGGIFYNTLGEQMATGLRRILEMDLQFQMKGYGGKS